MGILHSSIVHIAFPLSPHVYPSVRHYKQWRSVRDIAKHNYLYFGKISNLVWSLSVDVNEKPARCHNAPTAIIKFVKFVRRQYRSGHDYYLSTCQLRNYRFCARSYSYCSCPVFSLCRWLVILTIRLYWCAIADSLFLIYWPSIYYTTHQDDEL